MAGAYERLRTAASGVGRAPLSEDAFFDEIVVNPNRGFFDMYSRVSPFLAGLLVLGVGVANVAGGTPPSADGTVAGSAGQATASQTASARATPRPSPRPMPSRTPRPVTSSSAPTPAPTTLPASTIAPEPTAAPREVWVADLAAVDCFSLPPDVDSIGWVLVVDCRAPHTYEVFHVVDLPSSDGEYPGDSAVGLLSLAICGGSRFEEYVGSAYEDSKYYITSIDPSAENWAQGDREVVCMLNLEDLGPVSGSAQGSGQ